MTCLVHSSERLIIVKIGETFVANVYFPDLSARDRDLIICDICNQIEHYVHCNADTPIIVGGDFNSKFVGGHSNSTDLDNFMTTNKLISCDHKFPSNTTYTYWHDARHCGSWTDHFIVSDNIYIYIYITK